MDERLKKQLAFALEIDKEKNIFGRRIFPDMEEMKMMQSMLGIWRLWRMYFGNIRMKKLTLQR